MIIEISFWFVLIAIFVFGLIAGSFVNCAIWRFGAGESALKGRSYCPKCKHQLSWFDLAPVFSFLILRGKCRYCQKPISWQYPAVELAMGGLFCAAALTVYPAIFGGRISPFLFLELAAYWLFLAAMVMIFVADWRWYLIPDGALIAGFFAALILLGARMAKDWFLFGQIDIGVAIDPLIGAAFAGALFLAIFLASRGKWMGFGDVKLVFLMGFFLGFAPVLAALFLANLFGAIMGIGLICAKKKKMSSQIPFGPFLVFGALAAIFFSSAMINWYLSVGI